MLHSMAKSKKERERGVCVLTQWITKQAPLILGAQVERSLFTLPPSGSVLGFLAPVSLRHLGKLHPGWVHLSELTRSGCLFLNHLNKLKTFFDTRLHLKQVLSVFKTCLLGRILIYSISSGSKCLEWESCLIAALPNMLFTSFKTLEVKQRNS